MDPLAEVKALLGQPISKAGLLKKVHAWKILHCNFRENEVNALEGRKFAGASNRKDFVYLRAKGDGENTKKGQIWIVRNLQFGDAEKVVARVGMVLNSKGLFKPEEPPRANRLNLASKEELAAIFEKTDNLEGMIDDASNPEGNVLRLLLSGFKIVIGTQMIYYVDADGPKRWNPNYDIMGRKIDWDEKKKLLTLRPYRRGPVMVTDANARDVLDPLAGDLTTISEVTTNALQGRLEKMAVVSASDKDAVVSAVRVDPKTAGFLVTFAGSRSRVPWEKVVLRDGESMLSSQADELLILTKELPTSDELKNSLLVLQAHLAVGRDITMAHVIEAHAEFARRNDLVSAADKAEKPSEEAKRKQREAEERRLREETERKQGEEEERRLREETERKQGEEEERRLREETERKQREEAERTRLVQEAERKQREEAERTRLAQEAERTQREEEARERREETAAAEKTEDPETLKDLLSKRDATIGEKDDVIRQKNAEILTLGTDLTKAEEAQKALNFSLTNELQVSNSLMAEVTKQQAAVRTEQENIRAMRIERTQVETDRDKEKNRADTLQIQLDTEKTRSGNLEKDLTKASEDKKDLNAAVISAQNQSSMLRAEGIKDLQRATTAESKLATKTTELINAEAAVARWITENDRLKVDLGAERKELSRVKRENTELLARLASTPAGAAEGAEKLADQLRKSREKSDQLILDRGELRETLLNLNERIDALESNEEMLKNLRMDLLGQIADLKTRLAATPTPIPPAAVPPPPPTPTPTPKPKPAKEIEPVEPNIMQFATPGSSARKNFFDTFLPCMKKPVVNAGDLWKVTFLVEGGLLRWAWSAASSGCVDLPNRYLAYFDDPKDKVSGYETAVQLRKIDSPAGGPPTEMPDRAVVSVSVSGRVGGTDKSYMTVAKYARRNRSPVSDGQLLLFQTLERKDEITGKISEPQVDFILKSDSSKESGLTFHGLVFYFPQT